MSDTSNVLGTNEAYNRAMAWKNETNAGGAEYPSATNDRGYMGHRESHAYGDTVGDSMPDNNDDDNERHARGGMTGSSMPSQGGCYQATKPGGKAGRDLPSQGGHYMANMSGNLSMPRSKSGRERHAHGEEVGCDKKASVGMTDREEHGWGGPIGKSLKRTAGRGASEFAKGAGSELKSQYMPNDSMPQKSAEEYGADFARRGTSMLRRPNPNMESNPNMGMSTFKSGGSTKAKRGAKNFGKGLGKGLAEEFHIPTKKPRARDIGRSFGSEAGRAAREYGES